MSRLPDSDSFANQPIVLDNGGGLIKAGFAGAELPKLIFPNYLGRPKHSRVMPGAVEGDIFVGDAARDLKGLLKLTHPVQRGACVDWDSLTSIWHSAYDQLGVVQDQHPILLTESPLNARSHRAKCAEILFESFAVPSFHVQPAPLLSLFASGRTTGIVLDSGDGVTSVVPVVEGFVLQNAMQRLDIAGRDINNHLQLLLRKAGHTFTSTAEQEIVREIKEKCCYVAYNADQSMTATNRHDDNEPEVPYKLPDGSILSISSERYRATEVLFNPSILGSEESGVHQLLYTSINQCDLDLRRSLYSSICLSGGSTLFDGFGDRLLAEVRRLAPRDTKIKIWAPPERLLSPWIGGSICASLASFKQMWITRKQWDEHGASIVHRRAI